MAAQGKDRGRHDITTAQAGSPLTCFGVNQSQTRLYLIRQLDGNVGELAETADGWQTDDFASSALALDTALTCFGLAGIHPHVYFMNRVGQLIELQPDKPSLLDLIPVDVADGTPLSCLGLHGKDCRLFYVGPDRLLHELVADDTGTVNYEQDLLGTNPAPGTKLTCKQDSQGFVTVFYVDAADNFLHGLHHTSVQEPGKFANEIIKGTDPAPGTALTCFNMTGTDDARAYFLDPQGQINEVQWKKSTNVISPDPLDYQAMPGSALTCFGVGGLHTRLYYLDRDAQVNELAWQDGAWHNHPLNVTAAADSDLTCYGVDGKWTRLYYLDPQYRVNELAYDAATKKFVNTGL